MVAMISLATSDAWAADETAVERVTSDRGLVLAIIVAIFGLITLWLQHDSLRRTHHADAGEFTKSSVLIMVIIGAMLTVTMGLQDDAVAPAMGLFGTIVGYVIGAKQHKGAGSNVGKQPSETGTHREVA